MKNTSHSQGGWRGNSANGASGGNQSPKFKANVDI